MSSTSIAASANIIDTLSLLLHSIQNTTEPIIVDQIFNSLSINTVTDQHFLSQLFCNSNGNYISKMQCDCDFAFFGRRCTIPGSFYWGGGWTWFQVLFSMFYTILAILTWVYLYKYLHEEYGSVCKKIKRLYQTPKYLVMLNLIVICNTRIVYVAVDPFKQKGIFDRTTDRVLHEIIFSSSISMFFILLIVWMGLYAAFDIESSEEEAEQQRKCKGCHRYFHILKQIIIIVLLFIYPIQITFSYFRGKRSVDSQTLDWALIALVGLIAVFVVIFIYYTCKLKYNLSKSYESPNKSGHKFFSRKPQVKVSTKSTKRIKRREMKEFLKTVEEKSILNLIVSYILNPDRKKGYSVEDSDSELDYEDEMRSVDLDVFETAERDRDHAVGLENKLIQNYNNAYKDKDKENEIILHPKKEMDLKLANGNNGSNGNENEMVKITSPDKTSPTNKIKYTKVPSSHKEKSLLITNPTNKQIPKSKKKLQHKEFVLTQYDMHVLNKIFGLSYLIIIVAIFIVAMGVVLRGTSISYSLDGTIAVISFSFIFEAIAIVAIFYLFVRDIENKEYDNLKVIGEIENYLKNNQEKKAKLKFKDLNKTEVVERLKNFINIDTEEESIIVNENFHPDEI